MDTGPATDDPRAWIRVLVARYKDRLQAAEDDNAQEAVAAYREVVEDLEDLLEDRPPPRLPRRVIVSCGVIDMACEVVKVLEDAVDLRAIEPVGDWDDQPARFSLKTGQSYHKPSGPGWTIYPVDLAILQNAAGNNP